MDNMTEEEFRAILKSHDFFYEMSDDHRYWVKGKAERAQILNIVASYPKFKPIWEEYRDEMNNALREG